MLTSTLNPFIIILVVLLIGIGIWFLWSAYN